MKVKCAILSLVTMAAAWPAIAAEPPPPSVPFTIEGLCQVVQPMKHPLQGRLPILLWDQVYSPGYDLQKWREDGRLRKVIDDLARRGLALMPCIGETNSGKVVQDAMAVAQTLKEAGQPAYVLYDLGIRRAVLKDGRVDTSLYADAPTYKGPSPWNAQGELDWQGVMDWPAMTHYDVKPTVEFYRHWMKRFKDAGITVAAVFTDYEGLPVPWNFAYEGAQSEAGRKYYPAKALVSFRAFQSYTDDLRAKILSEAIADPVHETFPRALVGNFGESVSSEAYPATDGNLAPYAPRGIGRMNVMMPGLYANNVMLKRFYNPDWHVTQGDTDNIYFTILLQQLSAAGANKQPGQWLMPFVASLVFDDPGPRFRYGLSPDLYRELHRHALLRGVDGFYVFTTRGYPGQTPADIFTMVENTRAPYDELLEHREFLDKGKPMNFEVPAIRTKGLIWSGLRLKDRCLVRVFTTGPIMRRLDFVPFPGIAVSVDAPPAGATYLIDKRGRVTKVGSGL